METFDLIIEIIISIIACNFSITILGWFAWNVGLFSFTKDDYDDAGKLFPTKEYVQKQWDNWLWSGIWIPILLIIGYKGFDLNAFAPMEGLAWSDLFYFCSGLAAESSKYAYRKWKKKKELEK